MEPNRSNTAGSMDGVQGRVDTEQGDGPHETTAMPSSAASEHQSDLTVPGVDHSTASTTVDDHSTLEHQTAAQAAQEAEPQSNASRIANSKPTVTDPATISHAASNSHAIEDGELESDIAAAKEHSESNRQETATAPPVSSEGTSPTNPVTAKEQETHETSQQRPAGSGAATVPPEGALDSSDPLSESSEKVQAHPDQVPRPPGTGTAATEGTAATKATAATEGTAATDPIVKVAGDGEVAKSPPTEGETKAAEDQTQGKKPPNEDTKTPLEKILGFRNIFYKDDADTEATPAAATPKVRNYLGIFREKEDATTEDATESPQPRGKSYLGRFTKDKSSTEKPPKEEPVKDEPQKEKAQKEKAQKEKAEKEKAQKEKAQKEAETTSPEMRLIITSNNKELPSDHLVVDIVTILDLDEIIKDIPPESTTKPDTPKPDTPKPDTSKPDTPKPEKDPWFKIPFSKKERAADGQEKPTDDQGRRFRRKSSSGGTPITDADGGTTNPDGTRKPPTAEDETKKPSTAEDGTKKPSTAEDGTKKPSTPEDDKKKSGSAPSQSELVARRTTDTPPEKEVIDAVPPGTPGVQRAGDAEKKESAEGTTAPGSPFNDTKKTDSEDADAPIKSPDSHHEKDAEDALGPTELSTSDKGKGRATDQPTSLTTGFAAPGSEPPGDVPVKASSSRASRHSDRAASSTRQPSEGIVPTNHYLLPKDVPNSRILMFSYKAPKDTSNLVDFLTKTAEEFLKQLFQNRAKEDSKTPIVFLAHGFGCLVLQKAIGLLAQDSGRSDDLNLVIDPTVGIIFVDAPFPVAETEPAKSTQGIFRIFGTDTTPKKSIDTMEIWETFYGKFQNSVFLLWFYTLGESQLAAPTKALSSVPPPILPSSMSSIIFQEVKSKDSRRSSRTRAVRGPEYKAIVARIQGFLVFKVSTSNLDLLLQQYIDAGFPVDLKDHEGRTPLHQVSSIGIHKSVQTLMNRGHAHASVRDNNRQTPLHIAVRKAAEIDENDETNYPDQDKFKAIMQELMSEVGILNYKDKDDMTALEYAIGKSWITNALTFSGQGEAQTSLKLDEPGKPTSGAQKFASRKFDTVLYNFWFHNKEGKGQRKFQPLNPSIQRLVYYADNSAEQYISGLAKDVSCRWIHIPSNNERWLHDLFVSLRIQDDSMNNRRYIGKQPLNRYMIRTAMKYSHSYFPLPDKTHLQNPQKPEATEKDSHESEHTESEALALFMPILGYERQKQRQYLIDAVKKSQGSDASSLNEKDKNQMIVKGYMYDPEKPLQCRRTLHQYYYPMMFTNTEDKDENQVTVRWAQKHRDEEDEEYYPIIMVDQLWLWVLYDGTVISSFPDPWDLDEAAEAAKVAKAAKAGKAAHRHTANSYKLRRDIEKEFSNKEHPFYIKSAECLAHLILKTSLDFFGRKGPLSVKFQGCFQDSLNDVATKQSELLMSFNVTTNTLEDRTLRYDSRKRARLSNKLFKIDDETKLLVEIMGIQDELNIVNSVLEYQKEVLLQLSRIYDTAKDKANAAEKKANAAKEKADDGKKSVRFDFKDPDDNRNLPLEESNLLNESFVIVDVHMNSLLSMLRYAAKVEVEIKNLIDLKQKHANAWEARFAREGTEETQKQANIMLVFTIVTIIFLPMSFLTSFFALPIDVYPKDSMQNTSWPIRKVAGYLFGISVALFVPMLTLAFCVNRISKYLKRLLFAMPVVSGIMSELVARFGEDDEYDQDDANEKDGKTAQTDMEYKPEPEYAPLFGRFWFIGSIPILRNLWQYDEYDYDYPIHRFRTGIANILLKIARLLCCCFPGLFEEEAPDLEAQTRDWIRPDTPVGRFSLPHSRIDSPDRSTWLLSGPSSPPPASEGIEAHIGRVLSPSWESPINFRRSVLENRELSMRIDNANDYFGNFRGRPPYADRPRHDERAEATWSDVDASLREVLRRRYTSSPDDL